MLRTFALCLLVSHSRGFAADDINYAEIATKFAHFAVKAYAAVWLATKAIDAAQNTVDAISSVHPAADTLISYTVDPLLKIADIRNKGLNPCAQCAK